MKLLKLIIFLLLLTSCNKKEFDYINVSSLNQITGNWQWESSCGGIIATCTYPSKTNYQEIDFIADSQFIEKYNGIISFSATYSIQKINDTTGILTTYKSGSADTSYQNNIWIIDNRLIINHGEFNSSYRKIK